ncbi:hypothetical protein D3C81_1429370 [compost metagenome]
MILPGGSPVTLAAASTTRPGTCVPVQTSQPSGRTCTVQFTGSMVACARNGCWKTASMRVRALANALSTSPSRRATAPLRREALTRSATIVSVDTLAPGPSFQRITSACSPRFAAQVWAPITATPLSKRTTCCTPGILRACVSSTLASVPPNTGHVAIAA